MREQCQRTSKRKCKWLSSLLFDFINDQLFHLKCRVLRKITYICISSYIIPKALILSYFQQIQWHNIAPFHMYIFLFIKAMEIRSCENDTPLLHQSFDCILFNVVNSFIFVPIANIFFSWEVGNSLNLTLIAQYCFLERLSMRQKKCRLLSRKTKN